MSYFVNDLRKTYVCHIPFVVYYLCSQIYTSRRDGPLEKLWGMGNFPATGICFRYQIPCMDFFLGHSMNIF